MKSPYTARAMLVLSASVSALTVGTSAFAQAAPPVDAQSGKPAVSAAEPDTEKAPTGDIVVTGSRIARPNLSSPNPVTSIQGEEFFHSGSVSIGDQLNQLPQLASTFSQSNSTRFLGTAGLNLIDLRNLGTQRTLVLVNGRRHVAGDILNSGTSVDTNTIPTDLIDRVDIVTGGESAIYGSDAIAGVVNFVLKDHFQGLEARAQSGISTYGDGSAQFASVLAGKNFSEGRGNIAVNAEYAHQSQYFGSGRDYLNQQSAFIQVNPNGSAGNPEYRYFNDVRSASYSETGVIRFGGNAALNAGTAPNGQRYYVPYQFTPDGNLVPLTGQRVGYGPNGSFIGGNGSNFRSGDEFQIQPRLDRVNVSLVGHYDISSALVPFVEATWSHTTVFGSGSSGPAFINGTALGGDPRESFRLDNPYLTAQARGVITANLLAANPNAVITDATTFRVREILEGLGNRSELSHRDTYRIVAGLKGDFNGNWHYELAANYGEFREKTEVLGNLNIQRFLLANDAVKNGSGQIVCRSQVDPNAAYGYDGVISPVNQAKILANDISSCVPINVFGGKFTDAQKNYLLQNTTSIGKITQLDISGFVSGDSQQLFSLPGGPIGFSLGGEYRRETNQYQQDVLVSAGYTFYNSIPDFIAPALEVKEAYGELRIPLLKDIPLIRELTVTGAGRLSNYNNKTGTVYSYNGSVIWRPVNDLTLRASYARAVRAPNLGELYTPAGTNFATVKDPCSSDQLSQGPNPANRTANCAAAGIPAGYFFQYSNSLQYLSGGNPNLKAETSDSYTFGGVFQPHWVPGLAITVDYYNIKVNQAISSVDAQTIINQCYDLASLNNQFCGLFQRAGAAGGKSEVPYQILEGSLLSAGVNYAALQARGIDAEISYTHQIGNYGKLSVHGNYTHVIQRDDFTDPTDPTYITRYRGNLGTPIDRFRIASEFKSGPVTFGYTVRWYGPQYVGDYTNYNPLNGNPALHPYYADYQKYPAVAYHDLRVAMDVGTKYNMYLGVTNLADKHPPLDLTGLGGGSGQYDVMGRFLYAGVVAKF